MNQRPEGYGTVNTLEDVRFAITQHLQSLGCHVAILTRSGRAISVETCDGSILKIDLEDQNHPDVLHRQAFDANDPLRHYGPEYEEDYGLYERGNPEADE